MKTCTDIGTSNVAMPAQTMAEMFAAIKAAQEIAAGVRKLRYVLTEAAPMDPMVHKTKSYEMVFMHPNAFDVFVARLRQTNDRVGLVGLLPATRAEWMEWAKEAAALMAERRSEGQSG